MQPSSSLRLLIWSPAAHWPCVLKKTPCSFCHPSWPNRKGRCEKKTPSVAEESPREGLWLEGPICQAPPSQGTPTASAEWRLGPCAELSLCSTTPDEPEKRPPDRSGWTLEESELLLRLGLQSPPNLWLTMRLCTSSLEKIESGILQERGASDDAAESRVRITGA